jgi:hypothetical protein
MYKDLVGTGDLKSVTRQGIKTMKTKYHPTRCIPAKTLYAFF